MADGPVEPEETAEREPRFGAYARESEVRLAALGLQVQHLGEEFGDQVQEVFTDNGVRGDSHWSQRRGLSALLYAIADGRLNGLVVRDLERLARSVVEQEEVLGMVWRYNGRVITIREGELLPDVTGSEARALIRRQIAFAAEQELMAIRERRRRGLRRAAAAGRYTGGRPYQRKYGYRLVKFAHPMRGDVRTWEPVPEEMAVVWEIHDRVPGELTYQKMADELNARGVPTVTGAPWGKRFVWKIVHRAETASREGDVVVPFGGRPAVPALSERARIRRAS